MSNTVITVENLCKKYTIGHQKQARYETFRENLNHMGRGMLQRLKHPLSTNKENIDLEEFWALKDLNFEIERGDRVGIIGRNGAGKSTLLKILSRITEPTSGRVAIRGRVASLLEVGTGFHPELTGRENIFLNGAILGMSRAEIRKKFDEIVDFAEIEKFLDTPVKRYSSGMYVRLAFAVAAHLEPEILLVDEVLAVGDVEFQKKCIGKMEDVSKKGRTILFVSHNMGAIKSSCNSAMLLSCGSLVEKGEVGHIIDKYILSASSHLTGRNEVFWPEGDVAPGGSEIRLTSIRILDSKGDSRHDFDGAHPIIIEISYELFKILRSMEISIQIINTNEIVVFTASDYGHRPDALKAGKYVSFCTIPGELLNTGLYYVKISSNLPCIKVLVKGEIFVEFYVERLIQHSTLANQEWPGVIAPILAWKTGAFNSTDTDNFYKQPIKLPNEPLT